MNKNHCVIVSAIAGHQFSIVCGSACMDSPRNEAHSEIYGIDAFYDH